MRVWIICSGEAAVSCPPRCTAGEYNALRAQALGGGVGENSPRRVAANGRRVLCSPRRSALETAGLSVTDAGAETEELLDEIPLPDSGDGRVRPLWLWRRSAKASREIRERTEELAGKLEERGEDCVLISHPSVIGALIDALRVRGYCVQRTGFGRIRPFEQMLLSRREEHCGGCQHNCLLSNPGCNIGRDKAARMNRQRGIYAP